MVWSNILAGFVLCGCLSLLNCQSTRKDCKAFAPPMNGASRCIVYDNHTLVCSVACKDTYDFVYKPAVSYACINGKWQTWSLYNDHDRRVPWPDCKKRTNPSQPKIKSPQYYYKGDCYNPMVQQQQKHDYVSALSPPNAPPFFCLFNSSCKVQNVRVNCGKSSGQ